MLLHRGCRFYAEQFVPGRCPTHLQTMRGEDPILRPARWGDRNSHVHRISPGVVCRFASWLDHDRIVRRTGSCHRCARSLVFFLHTQGLPRILTLGPMIGPPRGEAPRVSATARNSTSSATQSELVGNTVRQPIQIRRGVATIHDETSLEPATLGNGIGIPGGTGSENGAQIMSLLPP